MQWPQEGPDDVRLGSGPGAWARRALLAVVLIGAAVIPSRAVGTQTHRCAGLRCATAGSVLWTAPLPGSWLAQPGVSGTVAGSGAYAAVGSGVAVVGTGATVTAYDATTGALRWHTSLAGDGAGASIVGVRAFAGVVAAGLEPQAGQSGGRREVILAAATGRQLREFPAAPYGGAVAAGPGTVVVVGPRAVADYATATGRTLWRRSTGGSGQAWHLYNGAIYVTDSGSGAATAARITAVRRIDLRTGAEHLIRLAGGVTGTFSEVAGGYLMFSGPAGVQAYDSQGRLKWNQPGAAVELAASGQDTVYLVSGSHLLGVDAATGAVLSRSAISVAASLYWVTGGIAVGLDQNALGEAWGYDLAANRVLWTSPALPWPHFFVDLSGVGGSATPAGSVMILATCAQVGQAVTASSAPACRRPRLAAVRIGSPS